MMANNNVLDIQKHAFSAGERILLDANIWLLVYGPSPISPRRTKIYSDAWSDICNKKCIVHIDLIILSEFVYRYARMEQQQTNNGNISFKEFRRSTTFKSVAKDITQTVKRILGYCIRLDSGFLTLDIDNVLQQIETGTTDFNDQVIEDICRRNSLILITDDADFPKNNLNILTANNRLLVA